MAEIGGILTKYLVQGISFKLAAGILVLAALGGCQHVQARGRFAQTVWPLVGGLTAVMMIFSVFQGDSGNLVNQNGSLYGWDRENFKNIVQGTGWFLSIFLGVGFLPFLEVQTDTPTGQAGFLFRTIGKATLWMGGVLMIFLAVFGERGRESLEYPILNLMAGVRLPGGFLRRMDLIFLSIMLFALLFTLGSIFFYSRYICERIHLPGSRIPAAVLSFLLGIVDFGRWSLVREYPKLLLYIFLPFFLGLTVCTSFLRRRIYAK